MAAPHRAPAPHRVTLLREHSKHSPLTAGGSHHPPPPVLLREDVLEPCAPENVRAPALLTQHRSHSPVEKFRIYESCGSESALRQSRQIASSVGLLALKPHSFASPVPPPE